jgi:tetrahydromethanopterin S-methyltransferase subunit H
MLNFNREQKVIEIEGIKFGGKPGEFPTVLIGSLFHKGDRKVKDEEKGIFDKQKTEDLIFKQKELSDKTGNPCMLDVVGTSEVALQKYIEYIAGLTPDPFLLNAVSSNVRIKIMKFIEDIGLIDKVVYTSINYTVTEGELQGLSDVKAKSVIIQSLNPRNPRISGMVKILKGENAQEGLISKALKAGLKNILLFTSVFEVPSIGVAARGIYEIKDLFGYPAGTAPVGVVGRWCIKNDSFLGAYKGACESTGITLSIAMGADFIIYGALEKAKHIFPSTALVDAMISRNSKMTFKNRFDIKEHPIFKLEFSL